jgi:hypothetical protein
MVLLLLLLLTHQVHTSTHLQRHHVRLHRSLSRNSM